MYVQVHSCTSKFSLHQILVRYLSSSRYQSIRPPLTMGLLQGVGVGDREVRYRTSFSPKNRSGYGPGYKGSTRIYNTSAFLLQGRFVTVLLINVPDSNSDLALHGDALGSVHVLDYSYTVAFYSGYVIFLGNMLKWKRIKSK
jgi:hypothetical protein